MEKKQKQNSVGNRGTAGGRKKAAETEQMKKQVVRINKCLRSFQGKIEYWVC